MSLQGPEDILCADSHGMPMEDGRFVTLAEKYRHELYAFVRHNVRKPDDDNEDVLPSTLRTVY